MDITDHFTSQADKYQDNTEYDHSSQPDVADKPSLPAEAEMANRKTKIEGFFTDIAPTIGNDL
jgi:hypothetical protein